MKKLSRCGNPDCVAIYLEPLDYEPLSGFCPECRRIIKEAVAREEEAFAREDCGETH